MLSVTTFVCLFFVIWCQTGRQRKAVTTYLYPDKPLDSGNFLRCEDSYIYIPVAFAIMFYLIYLVECWNCHTRLELLHKIDVTMVYEHVKQMQESLPFVWWEVVCYHYLRRTRQVTRYRNGDTFTSTQVRRRENSVQMDLFSFV